MGQKSLKVQDFALHVKQKRGMGIKTTILVKMVEVRGIEPLSKNKPTVASTCLAELFDFIIALYSSQNFARLRPKAQNTLGQDVFQSYLGVNLA